MSRYIKFLDTLENSDEIKNREELKKAINLAKAIEPKENIIMAGKSFFLNKYSQMYNDNPVNKDNNDYDSCDKYLYLENNKDFHEKMKCFQQQTLLFCDMLYDLRESVQYLAKTDSINDNNEELNELDTYIKKAFDFIKESDHSAPNLGYDKESTFISDEKTLSNETDNHYVPEEILSNKDEISFRSWTIKLNKWLERNEDNKNKAELIKYIVYPAIIIKRVLSVNYDGIKQEYYTCQSFLALKGCIQSKIKDVLVELYSKITKDYPLSYDPTEEIRTRLNWDDIKKENGKAKNVALMNYEGNEYWAINGKDEKKAPGNLIDALKTVLSAIHKNKKISTTKKAVHNKKNSDIYIVPLHDDVKCYIKDKKVWHKKTYAEYKSHYPNKKAGMFCCSERKLLSVLDTEKDGFVIYTLKQPCSKCSAAFRYLVSIGNHNFEVHCEEYDEDVDDLLAIP